MKTKISANILTTDDCVASKYELRKINTAEMDIESREVDPTASFPRFRNFLLKEVLREYSIVTQIQKIRNPFLDIYFAVASTLGEELFFTAFIPFCAWSVSIRLCIHYATLLALGIVTGNYLKNIFLLPRPASPPCWVRWKTDDHGLPSTHTISSFTLSTYIFLYIYVDGDQWLIHEYVSLPTALFFTVLWFGSISFSRLYNGLHTPIDVITGFCIGVILLTFFYTFLRHVVDCINASSALIVPIFELSFGAAIVYLHPRPPVPSSVLPESTLVLGVATGAWLAKWLINAFDIPQCFIIFDPLLPTYGSDGVKTFFSSGVALGFTRFFSGILILAATRYFAKKFFNFLCKLGFEIAGYRNYDRLNLELAVKYLNYTSLGIAVGVPAQYLFKYVGLSTPLDTTLGDGTCILWD
eukprot:TRINITY_DN3668_c0_g1_i2.p1 TRINITY_DN3668_c0_g1~~TRINITY_DN3668_c0_g1_i2.p1  ORF type:complete len:412 (+),score=41.73 TRINITY_DN3668_c0_g1_i2:153-1388(+)